MPSKPRKSQESQKVTESMLDDDSKPKNAKKLPKTPTIGKKYIIETQKGKVEFEAVKKSGFGKFKITRHIKSDEDFD